MSRPTRNEFIGECIYDISMQPIEALDTWKKVFTRVADAIGIPDIRQIGGDGFLYGLGTIRECLDCGCLVPGGPTRCKRCAREIPPWAVDSIKRAKECHSEPTVSTEQGPVESPQPPADEPQTGRSPATDRGESTQIEVSVKEHLITIENNGGMHEVLLNSDTILAFRTVGECAGFSNKLRIALAKASPSDANKRAADLEEAVRCLTRDLANERDLNSNLEDEFSHYREKVDHESQKIAFETARADQAEARVKELEAELAKKPTHQLEVKQFSDTRRYQVCLNNRRIGQSFTHGGESNDLVRDIRSALAAGPDATPELEALQKRAEDAEANASRWEARVKLLEERLASIRDIAL